MDAPWPPEVETVVVDGNNVMGATADGWWRDRPAAVRRLLERLQRYRDQCLRQEWASRLVLVLDVPQADLPEGEHDGVDVRYARRRGRDAADDRIIELLEERAGDPPAALAVVTSDRALAAAARQRGAAVLGAGTFLAHLRAADS